MASADSALDLTAMARARRLLARPGTAERLWPVIAAAIALTLASLGFATAMVLAPPLVTQHTAKGAPGS